MTAASARTAVAFAAAAAVLSTSDPAAGRDPGLHRHAVVVGANRASPGRRDLRFAHNDAQEIADTLIRVGGYAYDNVTVLLDPEPDQVLAILDAALAGQAGDGDSVLVFYYSGHADADALYPNGRPLPMRAVRQRLDDGRFAVRVGIIDACRGGGWTSTKGLQPAPPFPIDWPALLSNRGSVLIASSSGWENAHESEALRGSFFTHHWNAGLRGAADLNGDGTVTASEAFDYAQTLTVRDTAIVADTPQHPSFRIDLSGRRDLPLVLLDAAKTTLTLRQSDGPLQLVHLDSGAVVLESPRGQRDLRLSVRPGHYLVRRRVAGETRAKEIDVGRGSPVVVREADLQPFASGAFAAKSAAEQDVSAAIVPPHVVEAQLALGVRHAPVIDPGLRFGEGGPGAVGILRISYGLAARWQLMAPLAVAYARGDPSGWQAVTWAGQPVLGVGRTDAEGTIVAGLVGAGLDVRHRAGAHASISGSVAALGNYRWTSRAPDPGPPPTAAGRHVLDTWSLQASLGLTYFVSDAVSLSVAASVAHNLVADGDLAPWKRADPDAGVVVGVGSLQRRGLRTLPLVRVHLHERFTLDGHVALAYLPATHTTVETYLAGVTSLF